MVEIIEANAIKFVGPNDNYNLDNSHFLPAVIKKIYLAKLNKNLFILGNR